MSQQQPMQCAGLGRSLCALTLAAFGVVISEFIGPFGVAVVAFAQDARATESGNSSPENSGWTSRSKRRVAARPRPSQSRPIEEQTPQPMGDEPPGESPAVR